MKYYSTNRQAPAVTLEDAVVRSLAADNGLYMPERIPTLEQSAIDALKNRSSAEIALAVAQAFFADDVDADALAAIVRDTLSFETPVVHIHDAVYALELFHGPTLAFKDVGARFMARMLAHFIGKRGVDRTVDVIVATSGDTGSAVANGFLRVDGIRVAVLYPKGKVSAVQESQFTTLGHNITALEIDGTFDDCQRLVKSAFADHELNRRRRLTSANSINIARLLPQSFYYFDAYARLDRDGKAHDLTIAVPSGNFGNLTAGLLAARMGLPVRRFIAANNRNDVVCDYLRTGVYSPRPSVETIANAMDVGNPSNFARILDLFDNNLNAMRQLIDARSYADSRIEQTIRHTFDRHRYLLDPHGACGYQALADHGLANSQTALFLETAHPAKFKPTIDRILSTDIPLPDRLQAFADRPKRTVPLGSDFKAFKDYLAGLPD
jgi:threonine synthase